MENTPNTSCTVSPSAKEVLSPLHIITTHAQEGLTLRAAFFQENATRIIETGRTLALALARGHKIFFCGNGGSAADAQHLAGELVNRFLMDRPPLPAIALSTDTSILTAIGNDFGYEQIFAKQIQALGQPGDVLVGISTSGNSINVITALTEAQRRGLTTVGFVGRSGQMASLCDIVLSVQHASTPLIQEIHITLGHMLCRLIDYYLFENINELGLAHTME